MVSKVLFWLAIVATVAAIIFAIRAVNIHRPGYGYPKGKKRLSTILLVCVSLFTIGFWSAFGTIQVANSTTHGGGSGTNPTASPTSTVNPSAAVSPSADPSPAPTEDPNDFAPHFDFSAEALGKLLAEFPDRVYSTNSLFSVRPARVAAQALYLNQRQQFEDAVNFPIHKIAEKLELIQSGKLAGEELQALIDEVMGDIYVEVMKNPVMGNMVLRAMKEIPAIYRNNSEKIDELIALCDKYQEQGGLAYNFSVKEHGIVMVTDEYREKVGSYAVAYLRIFTATGITNRVSTKHWCLPTLTELDDNFSRTEESNVEDALPAILLQYRNKENGKETAAVGINIYDQRIEIFTPTVTPEPTPTSTPEPTPTSTLAPKPTPTPGPKPTPTPQPTPTPAPTPTPTPTPMYSLIVHYRIEGTTAGHEWRAQARFIGQFKSGDTKNYGPYDTPPGYHTTKVEINQRSAEDFTSMTLTAFTAKFTDHDIEVTIWCAPDNPNDPGPKNPNNLWEDPGGGGNGDGIDPPEPTIPPDLGQNESNPPIVVQTSPPAISVPPGKEDDYQDNPNNPFTEPTPVKPVQPGTDQGTGTTVTHPTEDETGDTDTEGIGDFKP